MEKLSLMKRARFVMIYKIDGEEEAFNYLYEMTKDPLAKSLVKLMLIEDNIYRYFDLINEISIVLIKKYIKDSFRVKIEF